MVKRFKSHSHGHRPIRGGGGEGLAPGTRLRVQIPSFLYSFRQKSCQVIGSFPLNSRVNAPVPRLENPGIPAEEI